MDRHMVVLETVRNEGNSLRYGGLRGPAASSAVEMHMIVSGDLRGGVPGILAPNSQSARRRRSLRSPSTAAPVSGRTFPPTPRLAETPLPAAEKLSENAPLPPTRSPAGAHFHSWLAGASAPPPLLRIARGQNPTHAVAATAVKIACLVASTVESGELHLSPLHKSSSPSARCNLHRRGRRVTRLEFLALRRS